MIFGRKLPLCFLNREREREFVSLIVWFKFSLNLEYCFVCFPIRLARIFQFNNFYHELVSKWGRFTHTICETVERARTIFQNAKPFIPFYWFFPLSVIMSQISSCLNFAMFSHVNNFFSNDSLRLSLRRTSLQIIFESESRKLKSLNVRSFSEETSHFDSIP